MIAFGPSPVGRQSLAGSLVVLAHLTVFPAPLKAEDAPYVDSKAITERFDRISAADMDLLRSKKILLATRSFGLNLCKGLGQLARQDKKYELLASYQRFDVFKSGGSTAIIPPDIFGTRNVVHLLFTPYPLSKRLEEVDAVLSSPPQQFGSKVDVVYMDYSTVQPDIFDAYRKNMESWQSQFPNVRFIYVTGGMKGPKQASANANAHAFGEIVREKIKGKAPLYDMEAILSGDWRAGPLICPEYSADPVEVHPNLPAGETMLAKGFLLILKEALAMNPITPAKAPDVPAPALSATPTEVLPADHPESRAVRAILDANGLTDKKVEGVSMVRGGRIVELYFQEGGVTEITDHIGALTALRKLQIYGDRSLSLPLLKKISPAIGRCTELEELYLNQNELTTLPEEVALLKKIRFLSIADNQIHDLPPAALEWAQHFDPKGLADQKPEAKP